MSIKGKPKDLEAFIADGAGEAKGQAKAAPTQQAARPASRMTKTIRVSTDIEEALKDAAYAQTKHTGRRVTESDVIDEALRKYFNM